MSVGKFLSKLYTTIFSKTCLYFKNHRKYLNNGGKRPRNHVQMNDDFSNDNSDEASDSNYSDDSTDYDSNQTNVSVGKHIISLNPHIISIKSNGVPISLKVGSRPCIKYYVTNKARLNIHQDENTLAINGHYKNNNTIHIGNNTFNVNNIHVSNITVNGHITIRNGHAIKKHSPMHVEVVVPQDRKLNYVKITNGKASLSRIYARTIYLNNDDKIHATRIKADYLYNTGCTGTSTINYSGISKITFQGCTGVNHMDNSIVHYAVFTGNAGIIVIGVSYLNNVIANANTGIINLVGSHIDHLHKHANTGEVIS